MTDTASARLARVIADEWETRVRENPAFATLAGDHRYNDQLPGTKVADFARRAEQIDHLLERLAGIERGELSPAEQVDYDFFVRELQIQRDDLAYGGFFIPVTKMNGLPVYLADVTLVTPFRTVKDFERYTARLGAFAGHVDDLIELMRAGMAKGFMPSRWALAGVAGGFRTHAASAEETPPENNVFYQPFMNLPGEFSEAERNRLRAAGQAAVRNAIGPAYQKLADFIEKEYLPGIPEDLATPRLPDPAGYYQFCIRRFTTLDLTAAEIHATGLAEVARIRAEMAEVMAQVGFEGTLREFSDALRADSRFFVDTPEALMKEVAYLMKRIEGQLPALFKTLPRTPFGLREVPDHLAPTSTSAYYMLPAGDGTTAGFYYVNTYDLRSRPLYEYEALSMHEAVPGHHTQLALQLEMPETAPFRKWGETTSFVEGWALYAERLGLEMGFYRDPYSNFGRLIYEMWRAARLVVDTGLHAMSWSRQQAIDYLAENTALSLLNIANEVDRYIAWPGQALAYKIGELKIRALRQEAEAALGARFDVREFHDAVLRNGGIPLSALERNIRDWVKQMKQAA